MIEDLFKPAQLVVPMSLWAVVAFSVLLALAAAVLVVGAMTWCDGGGYLMMMAGVLAYLPLHRFLRAVGPGDHLHLALVLLAALLAGAPVVVLGWRASSEGVLVATGALGVALIAALGIDHLEQQMALIPIGWGVLLFGGLALWLYVQDR